MCVLEIGDTACFVEYIKNQIQTKIISASGYNDIEGKQPLDSLQYQPCSSRLSNSVHYKLVRNELDTAPTMGETLKAIQQVKTVKVARVDGIPPDVWKHGSQALHAKFHGFVVHRWERDEPPLDLCDAVIITLYKEKGDK
ncbi:hypothetical protein BTVI_05847 [Pitangus sulphuratus]|nr:hypothetical protein BTVI_05847 [Pitangus sulphuratus]